jgi:hypothetical protein
VADTIPIRASASLFDVAAGTLPRERSPLGWSRPSRRHTFAFVGGTVRCAASCPNAEGMSAMTDRKTLVDTLRSTSAVVTALRKAIAVSGQLDAMTEIDTLLAVTEPETNRRLAAASH